MLHFAIDHFNRTRLPYNFRFQCKKNYTKSILKCIELAVASLSRLSNAPFTLQKKVHNIHHHERNETAASLLASDLCQSATNNQFHVSNEVVTAIHFSCCSVRSRAERYDLVYLLICCPTISLSM